MRRARGFTLIEMVVVVAIVAIVAAMAVYSLDATRRNVGVEQTAFDLTLRLQGVRMKALAEQQEHVVVVVGAPGNDSSDCSALRPDRCVRVYVVEGPEDAWKVTTFDPARPGLLAADANVDPFPSGVNLDLAAAGIAGRVPFDGVRVFEADVVASCGGRTCVALRFEADGDVRAEFPGARGATFAGVGLAFTSDLAGRHAGAERRAVIVGLPTAITKHFSYSL